ncbi:MAG: hypothetical protein ACQEXJ_20890 [Myxococcota bacterium]
MHSMPAMESLVVTDSLTIPGDCLSVSFVRDLGGDGTPEAARQVPTTVELRFEVRRCDVLDEDQKALVLGHRDLRADRRGTVRVVFGRERSRRGNLGGARELLTLRIREALEGRGGPVEEEPPQRRGGKTGLIKRRRKRRTEDG